MEEGATKQKISDIFKGLKWYEHLAAGWPLVLVFIGGAIGGACGGAAYGANLKIFSSKLSKTRKYVYSFLVGVASFIVFLALVIIAMMLFPNLFRR